MKLAVLGAYMFLLTATTTMLMAVKNGLFLSEFPREFIAYAMILGALVTAVVSVAFSGFAARARSRDGLAGGFLRTLAASLFLCWALFAIYPRSALLIYLWLEACGILLLIQAWSYVGDSVTARQGKRLMPLVGIGGSLAAIVMGLLIAPLAPRLGTENLLLLGAGLLWSAVLLLGRVEAPEEEGSTPETEVTFEPGWGGFARSSVRGFRTIRHEPLLRLVASALVLVMVTSTLIDFQFKLEVQSRFDRNSITAFYGLLQGAVGLAALLLQLTASRVIFPKFGISTAAVGHAGTLALNAAAVATLGGLPILFILQMLDDSLRVSIEKPAEQVSLLPFPRRIKGPAYATIGGVLRPLASALTAAGAIFLVNQPGSLPVATALAASGAALLYTRHRKLYLTALQDALARRSVDLGSVGEAPLVVDRTALSVIDRALGDREPMVVVFAVSLLPQLPAQDALPRVLGLLQHERKEVRSEAAFALKRLSEDAPSRTARAAVMRRLEQEQSPMALAALLYCMRRWEGEDVDAALQRFVDHESVEVRRAALLTLGRRGWEGTSERLEAMLSDESEDVRSAAAQVIGVLESTSFLPALAEQARDDQVRPSALEAMGRIGFEALDTLEGIIDDESADVTLRRAALMTMTEIEDGRARDRVVAALEQPELRESALRGLRRLREDGDLRDLSSEEVRPILMQECGRGVRFALAADVLAGSGREGGRQTRVGHELELVRDRAVRRTLDVLALSYPPDRIRAVEAALLDGSGERQGGALELLDSMLERQDTPIVMPLCESLVDRHENGGGARPGEDLRSDVLEMLRADDDWWIRALAIYAVAEVDPDALSQEERDMIPLIEKVMILKGSELFQAFPGEELAGVAALAEDTYLEQDEVLFREGDAGDAFYMVVQGAIRISREGKELAILGPREGFGEMAILDHETRSATASAAEPTTLLRIEQNSFDALVDRDPSVARGIYRMLSRRLRNTLAQVASQ